MHPILFTLELGSHAHSIASYGACLSLAIALGALCTVWSAKRAGLDVGAVIAACALCVGAGFVGAWSLHLAVQWARLGSLSAAIGAPGIAVYGGLLAGAAAAIASARWLALRPLDVLGLAVPYVALAQAVGRIGCLLGGCCYGVASDGPLSVRYHDELAPAYASFARSPVPLYEALLLVAIAAVLSRIDRRRSGLRVLTYLALYACVRLVLEPLRGDALRGVLFTVSTAQALSVLVLFASLGLFVWSLLGVRRGRV